MKDFEVCINLKNEVESNQNELRTAIRNHQNAVFKLQNDPLNPNLQKDVKKAEQGIILIGIAQKNLLHRFREEYRTHQNSLRANITKSNLELKRNKLSSALSRARKQNMPASSIPASSASDDSTDAPSIQSSPEQKTPSPNKLQSDFLNNLGLVTHEVYKEMLKKRVERKRRSTANPQFVYGNKGWDFQSARRKRNAYFYSSVSPPNTRQALRKRNNLERISPPLSSSNGNIRTTPTKYSSFPPIPNLPSGLTIERVSPTSSLSPDGKTCITCRQSGSLAICESCANGFHVSCHNRPLSHTPRQCPRCINKEIRTIGSLNVPSGMSVSVTPFEISEKLEEKKRLETVNKTLSAELTQLQDKHSQLTISLKNQKTQQDELLMNQHTTEDKIKQILTFISHVKNEVVSKSPQSEVNSTVEEGC